MKRVNLTLDAERDLDQIKLYLLDKAGIAVTRKVIASIHEAIKQIVGQPNLGHSRQDLTDRQLKFWAVYSYVIVYDPAARPIQIQRILHGKRDIISLLNRP